MSRDQEGNRKAAAVERGQIEDYTQTLFISYEVRDVGKLKKVLIQL